MEIYLPIAGMSVNILLILCIGGGVGFLSGMFGVGGGFLLTPLLIMIGIPPTVAAATDANQIAAASASGAYAHYKLGNVDVKMGLFLLFGGVIGGTIGVQVVKMLRVLGNADFFIKLCFVVFLGTIGSLMFIESLTTIRGRKDGKASDPKSEWFQKCFGNLPLSSVFTTSRITMCFLPPILLGVAVGILAAVMGVGGGFILVPAMVYLFGMPTLIVIGTSLFQILFTTMYVTFMQAVTNHTVDLLLALTLLLGGAVGAVYGVKVGKRLKGEELRILLSLIVIGVTGFMLYSLVSTPSNLVSLAE